MSGKKKVGRPPGPIVEDRITLRIKKDPNFPYLKKKLQGLAEKSSKTFEDFCVEILKSYVKRQYYPLLDNSNLEDEYYFFYKKMDSTINSKINELENKFKMNSAIKKQTLEEFISINYPHPLKKKVFCLELLTNHLASEFTLLEKLMQLMPSLNDNNKINFLDYYKENFNFTTEKDSTFYHYKAHNDLFSIYKLQLDQYGITITGESNFEIDFSALEHFLINELYKDINYSKSKSKEIYLKELGVEKKIEKRRGFRKDILSDYFHKYLKGSLEKLEVDIIREKKKEIDEVEKKHLNNKNKKENIRYFEERKQFLLDRKTNGFTKKDFINELNEYFNNLFLSSMTELPFKFNLYFIPIAFNLDAYYQFLNEKHLLLDFFISLKENLRIVNFSKENLV